ncbi:Putative DNA-binding proteinA [bacterium HR23]|nr:Putative DNA-binding proteinA [bacterium HR23]
MSQERQTLTVAETAPLLGIGRQSAYERIKAGEIPCIRVGRRLLAPRRALEKLLEQGQATPRPGSEGCRPDSRTTGAPGGEGHL